MTDSIPLREYMQQELSAIRHDVARVRGDVDHINMNGATVTVPRIETILVEIKNLRDDVEEIKSDNRAVRTTIRGALITAASSIAVSIILFFVLRAQS
jgi:ferritin